jgi:hypothetical protein
MPADRRTRTVPASRSASRQRSGQHVPERLLRGPLGLPRWTGRMLRVEIEGWVDPDLTARDADVLGRQVAAAVARRLPEAGSLTWTSRAAPG